MCKSRIELIFGHKLGIFFRFQMPYFIWVSLIYKNRYDRLYLFHCIQNPYFAHFFVGIFETKLLTLYMLHVHENLSILLKRIDLNACTFLLIRLASFLVRLIISGTALVSRIVSLPSTGTKTCNLAVPCSVLDSFSEENASYR